MKVVLAFSGGLDTSFCVPYLRERGHEVVTVFVDTGGFTRAEAARIAARAKELGAARHVSVNAERAIYDRVIGYLIRAGGLYEQTYPNMCADRYVIVEACVEVARRVGATTIAHGCTAMGNDQVRFDCALRSLGKFGILAPIRDFHAEVKTDLRARETAYLERRGFEVAKSHRRYSINRNVLGVTISGSEIDKNGEPAEEAFVLTSPLERAPNRPERIRIGFAAGLPVALDGRKRHGIEILKELNRRVGRHGAGRFIYTGDCVIGIKGRIAFECPGLSALLAAHRAIESATLSREQIDFKSSVSQRWATLAYNGLFYDPLARDLERFLDSNQRNVTGEATIKVFKGTILPVAHTSPNLLRDEKAVYAQAASWTPAEAEAFVKLFGLGTEIASRKRRR